MTLRFRPGEPIVLRGRIQGPRRDVSISLLLDTGASRTLIRPKRLAEVGIDSLDAAEGFTMTTVSGTASAKTLTIPALKILGVYRPDFEIVAFPLPSSAPVDGLLGLDFLVGLRLTLDMRAGELTVEA